MRRSMLLAFIVLTLLSFTPVYGQTAPSHAKHPFTFKDMMALKRIGSPSLSPDGKWVLFTAMDVDLDQNTRINHIWVVPSSGGDARPLTHDPAGESGAHWSPDGKKFLFVSARGGSQQVWVAEFNPATGDINGNPKAMTHISTEADGAIWSPDSKNIVFTSRVYPGCRDDLCNKSADKAQAKSKVKARIFTRLLYRHWNAYTGNKRTHLFVVPAEGGTAKDLTPGDHDVPPFSLGGQDLYTISPDGHEVAFTSNIDEVEATSTNNDIFVVPIAGGEPKKLSTSPGGDSTPVYSPDGKWLAWRMQVRPGYESDRFRLVICDRKTGKITNLTEGWDHWVENIAWAPDSRTIYLTSEDKGEIPIYKINVYPHAPTNDKAYIRPKSTPTTAWYSVDEVLRGADDELQVSHDGKTLVFSRMSVQAPTEIYKLAIGSKEPVQLTHLNDPVLSEVIMPPMDSFWFAGAGGTRVQGFIIKPPNFNAQRKYPVKFLIHGGPQGQWGDEWSYRWNAELFAATGYVVVMINPRGSTGYGQQFIDQINGDWGGKPYVDLMKGLDFAEQKYSFIDKNRECALGASYGGYMIDWILGHTNRFKCLVSHDGMFNTESAYGTTEELWFPEWEFKGTPWTNREMYRRWSPALFATQFKTPTLVVHSQLDYRLDVSEGFQLFTTLQRLKVPSKMLYFPDEGHFVLKPQNSELWYRTVNGWVAQWTQ